MLFAVTVHAQIKLPEGFTCVESKIEAGMKAFSNGNVTVLYEDFKDDIYIYDIKDLLENLESKYNTFRKENGAKNLILMQWPNTFYWGLGSPEKKYNSWVYVIALPEPLQCITVSSDKHTDEFKKIYEMINEQVKANINAGLPINITNAEGKMCN